MCVYCGWCYAACVVVVCVCVVCWFSVACFFLIFSGGRVVCVCLIVLLLLCDVVVVVCVVCWCCLVFSVFVWFVLACSVLFDVLWLVVVGLRGVHFL